MAKCIKDSVGQIAAAVNKTFVKLRQFLCPYHRGQLKSEDDGYGVQITFIDDENNYRLFFINKEKGIFTSFKIEYCPFCGRKLTENQRINV